MAKERSIDWYKSGIKNGLRFQQKYAGSQMWPVYKNYYRHNFPRGVLPVNMVFSILRSMVPQTYFRNPSVTVTPSKPGLQYELHARLVESIDRWLLRELMTKYEIKRMITDAFLCGTAHGFIGYDSMFGFDPSRAVDGNQSVTLTQFDKKGYRLEYNTAVNPGMPWFLRARPEDVVYPWGTQSSRDAEWVALRVFRPLEDLKKDSKYKNTKNLTGMFTQQRTTAEGTSPVEWENHMTDHEWVELWQIHDAKTKEIIGLTMDSSDFLRQDEDLMQIEGLPVESMVFNPDPDYIYGIPDAKIIEPQLLEMNEIRTQAMKHRRLDLIKMLVKKGSISPDAIKNLFSEDIQAAVEIDAEANLRDSVLPLQPGVSGILGDLANMGEIVRGDVRESVGFSRSATGEYMGKTHITSKETEVVAWANQIRVDERRDIVADLLQGVVRRFNQLVFTYWTTPQVRSIVGPDGAKWWLKFTGPEIRSEYNIKVDPTDAVPVNPMSKKQDAVEMARAYAEMNQGLVKSGRPAPAEIQRAFFNQFEGVDVDRLLAQLAASPVPQGQPGQPGGTPQQALPPEVAAQLMQQGRGGR